MDGLMAFQIPWSASLHCPMLGWVGPLWSLTRAQVFFSFTSEARSFGKVSTWGLGYFGETRNSLPIRVAPKDRKKNLPRVLVTLTTPTLSWSAL